jgi:glycine cleavage system protein P-like pyridoxal-binding family
LHHTIDGDMFDSDVNTVLLHKSFCHFHGSQ